MTADSYRPGARKRVLLHIGAHKTGSTSLQWALTRSAPVLAAKGVLYPEAGRPSWARLGHHSLAFSFVRRAGHLPAKETHALSADERAALWRQVHDEIAASAADTIVLSSEEFDVLDTAEIADVARELERYSVTPVVFLRNTVDFVESSFRTSIIHGGYRRSIDEFASGQRSRLDYAALLRDWRMVAVDGKVTAFAYDDPEVRRNAVSAFFDLLGVPISDLSAKSREKQNESAPAFICELVRSLRVEGASEEEIGAWLGAWSGVGFSRAAHADYTLMPAALGDDLHERYCAEVIRIAGEQSSWLDIRGKLSAGCELKKKTLIADRKSALLVLGQEIASASAPVRDQTPAAPAPQPVGRSEVVNASTAFASLSETEWEQLWLRHAEDGSVAAFPPMAPLDRQQLLHGTSGVAAMQGALKFRRVLKRHLPKLPSSPRLLDFGCGWGRHIRAFLKDFPAPNITGVDIDPDNISLCRELLPGMSFVLSKEGAQLPVESDSQDLILSFSVFSHINEESAQFWLRELGRVLKPGGSMVVTSWGRSLFEVFERKRTTGQTLYAWEDNIARAFEDLNEVERRYHDGEFSFGRHMKSGPLDPEVYGISLMPKRWIETHTPLRVWHWIEDTKIVPQTTFFISKD